MVDQDTTTTPADSAPPVWPLPGLAALPAAPDEEFDRFAAMVRRLLDVPLALVTLVDQGRQVFPGASGLDEPLSSERCTPLSHSFCQHVVTSGRPLVVVDARVDERVRGNLAIADLGVIAYAGMPLMDADGRVVGSLCAIDHEPREFTALELLNLADLAAACSSSLVRRDVERRSRAAERAAMQSTLQTRLLLQFSETMVHTNTEDDVVAVVRLLAHQALGAEYSGVAVKGRRGVRYLSAEDLPPGTPDKWLVYDSTADLPGPRVMRTGTALLYPDPTAIFADFPHLRADPTYPVVGARAYLPLIAGGASLGWLGVGWQQPRVMDQEFRELLASLARTTSQAMHRAGLMRERREVAFTLQEALLSTLPEVPGLHLAARYWPASTGDKVGGDWYDALAGPSRTTLVIGDVAGHDVGAAAQMGHLRSILRGFAVDREERPSALLGRLDRANLELGSATVATALVAHLEPLPPVGDVATLTWSSAGHYAPVLVHPDGRTEQLGGRPDLLLGIDGTAPRVDHVDKVPVGSTLLLFTDGLVELRGKRIADRLVTFQEAAASVAGESLDVILDTVLAAMAHVRDRDDVAVLAARPFRPDA
ncbi:GAF domain-containing SpoIIE family protein phosphatase [Pengzhenrongella sicca]|uniref:SpoIIE family protein phosphatase n=1 Tax=Pengzhenrongella sicca TaxID=2819238 RepID=A0A8A4ZFI6_9MICO|nr:SpoIIE family protein phosphatase [Pengzhenrongella sicca]QTE30762.1 SpoIIE family protein phosphatase [Pengzhenrongella sicca]